MSFHFKHNNKTLSTTLNIQAQPSLLEDDLSFKTKIKDRIRPLLYDVTKIKELESIITNCIVYHTQQGNFPKDLPNEINIELIRKTHLHRLETQLTYKEDAARNQYHGKENQTIKMSLDLLNPYIETNDNNYILYNDFLNKLKKEVHHFEPNKFIEIVVESVFLHELGHAYLNKKFNTSLLVSYLKRDNIHENALKQVGMNMAEGFCDSFSSLLTAKKYDEIKIFKAFDESRYPTQSGFPAYIKTVNTKTLSEYEMDYLFDNIKNNFMMLKNQDIETSIAFLLENALNNTLKLTSAYMNQKNHFKEVLSENIKTAVYLPTIELDTVPKINDFLKREMLENIEIKQFEVSKIEQIRNKMTKISKPILSHLLKFEL